MAHIHEKIDFTASVFIVKGNAVLFHKHKKIGLWLPPGGHVELDEDPNQAAMREAKEETGLDIELFGNSRLPQQPTDGTVDLIPPMFLNRHRMGESHEHIDFVYFARPVGGELHAEDGGEMIWVGERELVENEKGIRDNVRSYALAALRYFGGKQYGT